MELDMTTIALALASISLGLSVVFAVVAIVAGIASIYITIKAVRASDEFAQKADTTIVKDLVGGISKALEDNMEAVLPRIREIEKQVKQLKNP